MTIYTHNTVTVNYVGGLYIARSIESVGTPMTPDASDPSNTCYQRRRHGHNHEQVKLTTSLYHTLTDTSYHITTFLTDDKTLWILLHFQD